MKIDVKRINLREDSRYPYSYRVEVSADALASDKVSAWLAEAEVPHTQTGWGVFYMKHEDVVMLTLKFGKS